MKAIVPLLNGIDHLALLRERYGAERIIPATIAVESERVAPAHIVHRSSFARLNVLSAGRNLLSSTLDELQKFGFECRFMDHEPTLMWSKLVFLGPFALTTTASDKGTGEILSDPHWRELGMACIREACAVAVAEGAKLNADAVIAGLAKMPGNMRSSMQKDVEQGRVPELDAIAGPDPARSRTPRHRYPRDQVASSVCSDARSGSKAVEPRRIRELSCAPLTTHLR